MNKNTIKVIKRNKKSLIEKTVTASQIYLSPAKVQITSEREIVNAVNGWIDERGANRRMEKIAASREILTWKIIADDSKAKIYENLTGDGRL